MLCSLVLPLSAKPVIRKDSLPPYVVGVPYDHALQATGGAPPYRFFLASGRCPPGCNSIRPPAALRHAHEPGRWTGDFRVLDSKGDNDRALLPIISNVTIFRFISSPPTAAGLVTGRVEVIGGQEPLSFRVISGDPPQSFKLSQNSGAVEWTQDFAGVREIVIQVQDQNKTADSLLVRLGLPALSIETREAPKGFVNIPYSFTFRAAGGTPPYQWSHEFGLLPRGLKFDQASATLSGTPEVAGQQQFLISVTDAEKQRAQLFYILPIELNALEINQAVLGPAQRGRPYSFRLTSRGGQPPVKWALRQGSVLPPGIEFVADARSSGDAFPGRSLSGRC